jgi:hypothetical protein
VRLPAQRRALGALFVFLSLGMAGIAYAAGTAHRWPIVGAAAAIGLWFAALAARSLRS